MKAQPKASAPAQKNHYQAGTLVKEIRNFDRSIKVQFHCPEHSESKYASKDPFCSHIFIIDGWANECDCPIGEHVLTVGYSA